MVSEIKGPGSGVIAALEQANAASERPAASRAPGAAPPQAAGVVELTPTAERLQALTRAVAEVPQVDEAAVTRFRQALAEGAYRVDAEQVADKFTRFEAELGGRGSGEG